MLVIVGKLQTRDLKGEREGAKKGINKLNILTLIQAIPKCIFKEREIPEESTC